MTTHSCWVEIRTRALEDNFRFLMKLAAPHVELLAVVKDYAYGHSLKICAPAVARAGARWLGVARVDEGVRARALCPEPGVLVMCGALPGEGVAAVEHRLSVVAWQPWQLDELEAAARTAGGSVSVHLEIDTGMSRQGIAPEDFNPEGGQAGALLARFHSGSPLRLEGVMTHLFAADEADGSVTAEQLARLDERWTGLTAAGALCRVAQRGQFRRAAGRPGGRDCRARRAARDEGHAAARPGALWPGAALRPAI